LGKAVVAAACGRKVFAVMVAVGVNVVVVGRGIRIGLLLQHAVPAVVAAADCEVLMHMVVVLLCRGWGELLLVLAVVMTAGLVVPAV
jgi:hypothetical protein